MASTAQTANGHDVREVRARPSFRGKQGHLYAPGYSSASLRTNAIPMHILMISLGEVGRPHEHEGLETEIYIVGSGVRYGEAFEHHETARISELMYIPSSVPHRPCNPTDTTACVAILARTDPNDREAVVLLPNLDNGHATTSIDAVKGEDFPTVIDRSLARRTQS